MLRALLVYLVLLPSGWFCLYFVNLVVPMAHPLRYPFCGIALVTGIWAINTFLLPAPSVLLQILTYLLEFLLLFFLSPQKQKVRAVFTQTLLFGCDVFVNYLLLAVLSPILSRFGYTVQQMVTVTEPIYLLSSGICTVCSIPILYGAARILKKVLSPALESRLFLWFLPIPVSQLVLSNLSIRIAFGMEPGEGYTVGVALGLLLSLAADVACVISYLQLRKLQHMDELLRQEEKQLHIQTEHYRSLYASISQVNQIRHDLSNQLQAAYRLLEQGRQDLVREQLDVLRDSIRTRVGSRYCSNLMVDAVLTEKAELCRERGVKLEIACMVPQDIPLENAHLCSAFSNLLDNAISGTLESGRRERPIVIRADIQREFLVIRCENPAGPVRKRIGRDPLREHGVGTEILGRLAAMYQGELKLEHRTDSFCAVLFLHLPKTDENQCAHREN